MPRPLPTALHRQPPHASGEAGLTQEQLPERSGFSQQYISGLERGKRHPTIVTLYELASALGVSHVELVRED
ncbi:MAG TPA: helix-turn-helix transcriptional regulator [Allosphingosinicella sp.]|jgi:transcriptional regulator with XRE-family HTH domain